MSNNKLTDRKIAEILARAEICDDSVLTDYTDIAAAMRELQERRRLDGIQHAVCEVCGVPCNNPNHPQMAVAHEYSVQPVPVVPDEMATSDDMNLRAAMLQGAEAVSNRDELPLDYLQGHKDGLEWAAQLAEANHPQTGDWLYDDPIELARAIRKGPDMPTVQAGNSQVIPDGYALVPVEPTDEMIVAAMDSDDVTYNESDDTVFYVHHREIYKAMLAAAPKPETGHV